MKLIRFFTARKVEMTDNSNLWEIVTPDGERVADCTDQLGAEYISNQLNLDLSDWIAADTVDRTANIALEWN